MDLLFGEMMRKGILGVLVTLAVVLVAGCGNINSQDVSSQVGISVARRGVSIITPVPASTLTPVEEQSPPEAAPTNIAPEETPSPDPADQVEPSSTPTTIPPATSTPLPAATETQVPPASSGGCAPELNRGYESEVIRLINQERGKEGLAPLVEQSQLTQAARLHSQDMACNQFFSHVSPTAGDVIARVTAQGYSYSAIGENIAAGQADPSGVVQAWMNSTGHRANIMNATYTQVGVGYAYLAGDSSGVFWTLLVGAP